MDKNAKPALTKLNIGQSFDNITRRYTFHDKYGDEIKVTNYYPESAGNFIVVRKGEDSVHFDHSELEQLIAVLTEIKEN